MAGERFDCAEAWRLVEQHAVTNMFTVPTILTMLTRDAAVDLHNHSSLRYVIYAGAPMYRSDQVHALTKLGSVLVQYYGLGEVTGNITVLPPHLHSHVHDVEGAPRSVGFARVGMQISIRDGEICVRGPGVFAGYFEDEDANQCAFRDGWFHTGDLGYLDDRGFLFITGRVSDMFISGGSNVYPREIEEALLEHPCVSEVCIVGMPDDRWGEVGVAVVVPSTPVTPEALHDHLVPRLARYKHPARYVFWDTLPKTAYGKVAKKEIRGMLDA
jgi:acyl-CoA synthetase (AMP-forming)/AMP-acid ligase II